jgi:hypothetical protein
MAHTQAIRANFSRVTSPTAVVTDVPRSESLAGSVLAVLPAVYGVSLVLPVAGYAWNPIEYAVVGLAFYIASVALAAADEYRLRNDDIEAASAYWALLGTLPYLAARARVLVKEDRPGIALLWIALVTSIATVIGLALLALV